MNAVEVLLEGLVDYAGLFPPASEDMVTAVTNYASYRDGPDAKALGRFIVPVGRLSEFEQAARDVVRRNTTGEPWRLSVIVTADTRSAAEQMLKFNCHHWSGSEDGHALIDAVELKAASAQDVEQQHRDLPSFFQRYFEVPLGGDIDALVTAIAGAGARAKARTGGITRDAFPASRDLLAFLKACHREKVAFKATAGLHHPVRGQYRLTYELRSESGTMYGFLNLFLAAALVARGESDATVLALLEESDPRAFEFSDGAISWKGHRFDAEHLRQVRSGSAVSFGSCSFREPVDELARLVSEHV
ncbi:MAG TPA: hypothetical protein VNO75_02695 [Gemmatimonadaceae bacterium]|nr:hypothetical protein [Gemmatimonadaceae bacterium]